MWIKSAEEFNFNYPTINLVNDCDKANRKPGHCMEVFNNPQRQAGIREVIQILHQEPPLANATSILSSGLDKSTRGEALDLVWGIPPNLRKPNSSFKVMSGDRLNFQLT